MYNEITGKGKPGAFGGQAVGTLLRKMGVVSVVEFSGVNMKSQHLRKRLIGA